MSNIVDDVEMVNCLDDLFGGFDCFSFSEMVMIGNALEKLAAFHLFHDKNELRGCVRFSRELKMVTLSAKLSISRSSDI